MESTKQCPFCKENIHQDAKKCKHCSADLTGNDQHFLDEAKKRSLESKSKREVIECSECGYHGDMGLEKEWTPMATRVGAIFLLVIIFGFDVFLKMNGRSGMNGIWSFVLMGFFLYSIFIYKKRSWMCPSCEHLLQKT